MFSFKKLKCRLCKKPTKIKNLWTCEMKTADGLHTIKVCKECLDTLENMKDTIHEDLL